MGLALRYLPPPSDVPGPSPFLWGEEDGVRSRLGDQVRDLRFERRALFLPALSPAHGRRLFEDTFGPTVLLVRALAADAARLADWRSEHDRIAGAFFADGRLRFEYLMTCAVKV
jgi:hypothetical protein